MDDSLKLPKKVVRKTTCYKCGLTIVSNLEKCPRCERLLEEIRDNSRESNDHT